MPLVGLLLGAGVTQAQVVRGNISERVSAAPVVGAVVTLVPDSQASRAGENRLDLSALSDSRGAFAIRSRAAGRFRITVRRIGSSPHVSEPFELQLGETRQLDIVVDAARPWALAAVEVVVSAVCTPQREHRARLLTLWEETRTALTVSEIASRDSVAPLSLIRYSRTLDPGSLKVLSLSHRSAASQTSSGFASLSGDSLSIVGYVVSLPNSNTVYHAPDANALLSEAFIRDHCFTLIESARDRAGLVGLRFEPSPSRTVPDIEGTIWLDVNTSELRFVEFRWTQLRPDLYRTSLGGEVRFARLQDGLWFVRRWFVRMPQGPSAETVARFRQVGIINPRRMGIEALVEEGGIATGAEISLQEKPAGLRGTVLDSAGRPLAGATVGLAGTAWREPADKQGRFTIDSVLPGVYTARVDHPWYAALGMAAAESDVVVVPEQVSDLNFRAAGHGLVAAHLCRDSVEPGTGILRVTLLDPAGGGPMIGAKTRLQWIVRDRLQRDGRTVLEERDEGRDAVADTLGAVIFCDVPSRVVVQLSVSREGDAPLPPVFRVTMKPGEILGRVVTLPDRDSRVGNTKTIPELHR